MRQWAIMLVLVAACAPSSARSGSSRDTITAEDIDQLNVSTAMDVIQRLHPEFLRGRGRNSISAGDAQYPVVYVDGVRAGELNVLRGIPAHDVRQIQFVSATDATTRYGTGHTGGVIEVRLRGGSPMRS
jgi:TonB-dependent Receptor Plug Domain